MKMIIEEVYNIIQDYREQDNLMSPERIERWIEQFDESDRIFILTELRGILNQRYFSKSAVRKGLKAMIEYIAEKVGFKHPADFLKVCEFINHQPDGKSQKDFLSILADISLNEFDFDLSKSNPIKPQYFIYLDDLLCTGDTVFKGLAKIEGDEKKGWLFQKREDKSNLEYIKSSGAKLLLLYFAIHKLNLAKLKSRLTLHLGEDIRDYYNSYAFIWVENDFDNDASKLDYLFPVKLNQEQNVLDYFESLKVGDKGVFRPENLPKEESFFSSSENRIRFENILLQKGLELYNLAGENRNPRMRPLGYGLTSHKNLGFGTLCFTYRNVPFNTPLVFWYPYHNWTPLFQRNFINY